MAYAVLADLRKLAGGISSTTLSDSELQDFLDYGDVMAEGCTGLRDVPTSDKRYHLMVQCAEYFASSAVRDHLSDPNKMATTHYERAKTVCEIILAYNSAGGTAINSVSQGYMTFPLNESGKYFGKRYSDMTTESDAP